MMANLSNKRLRLFSETIDRLAAAREFAFAIEESRCPSSSACKTMGIDIAVFKRNFKA